MRFYPADMLNDSIGQDTIDDTKVRQVANGIKIRKRCVPPDSVDNVHRLEPERLVCVKVTKIFGHRPPTRRSRDKATLVKRSYFFDAIGSHAHIL
jgi:hypothetical protein